MALPTVRELFEQYGKEGFQITFNEEVIEEWELETVPDLITFRIDQKNYFVNLDDVVNKTQFGLTFNYSNTRNRNKYNTYNGELKVYRHTEVEF